MSMQHPQVGNIVVGKPDIDTSKPSHVRGVHEGNWPGKLRRTSGVRTEDAEDFVNAVTRSTGINPERRAPIDPRMPFLTPA